MKIVKAKKAKSGRVKELKKKKIEKVELVEKDEYTLTKNLNHDGQQYTKGFKFTKEDKNFEILKQHAE